MAYASLGNEQLLVSLTDVVPRFLHPDSEQFGVVCQLVLGPLLVYLAAFDGMRAAPPVGNGNADGGEEHGEGAVVLQQVVIIVAHADGHRRQVLAGGDASLQVGGFHLLLQQLVFGQQVECRCCADGHGCGRTETVGLGHCDVEALTVRRRSQPAVLCQ